jgi:hypothetical protein
MTVIEEAVSGVDDGGRIILAGPDYTGANLLLYEVETATDGDRANPIDLISATFAITVKGY